MSGTTHISDANDDGSLSPSTFVRRLREGCVLRVRTPAGTYHLRRNPRGDRFGRNEFTILHYGWGGGFTSRFGHDQRTVEHIVQNATGEKALRIGGVAKWPDDHDAVPESSRGGV